MAVAYDHVGGWNVLEAGTLIAALSIIATLIGVAITQWNNMKTKRMELDHNRDLKILELNEQRESTPAT
jgi:hypothetical protein